VRAALYGGVGTVAMILVILVFLDNALQILGLVVLSRMIDNAVFYLPNLAVVALIGAIGILIANMLSGRLERALEEEEFEHARLVAKLFKGVLLAIVGALLLWQLGFAREIVLAAFLIAFGAVGVAFAVALGLGSAKAVQRGWESLFEKKKSRRWSDRPEQLARLQRERGAGARRGPDHPLPFHRGRDRLRRPDLDGLLVEIDDPVGGHAHLLVEPPLGEAVRPLAGGARHLDYQQQRPHAGPIQRPRFLPRGHEEIRLYERVRTPGDVRRGQEDLSHGVALEIRAERDVQPTHHPLMGQPRRGRHEQLAVDGLVAVAVVGEGANHGGRVVGRGGHAHKVGSA
jgi:hypothetical protein